MAPATMRLAALPLATLLVLTWAPPGGAASLTWPLIDVRVFLENDGKLSVTETHHVTFDEGGGGSLFREFGLGADQSIAFRSLTRIDPEGVEHPLEDGEVEDPDHYRYYDRGHVYFRLPEAERASRWAFRFEYELVNAVAPAWTGGP